MVVFKGVGLVIHTTTIHRVWVYEYNITFKVLIIFYPSIEITKKLKT